MKKGVGASVGKCLAILDKINVNNLKIIKVVRTEISIFRYLNGCHVYILLIYNFLIISIY